MQAVVAAIRHAAPRLVLHPIPRVRVLAVQPTNSRASDSTKACMQRRRALIKALGLSTLGTEST